MRHSRDGLFPFQAIVGQERLKKALLLNAVNPRLGGVLVRGEKGTAKSTAVRALGALLPDIEVVAGCPFSCDPRRPERLCPGCRARVETEGKLPGALRPIRVVDLPVGSTEDRVVGTLDIERAIKEGEKHFEPGILAAANRGILYVDEVNLLEDHIVDVLLDSAAMGVNVVEREGVSFSHPAEFILIGTMNPEEGELRPQLLDRFGLCVGVAGSEDLAERVEVVRRWAAYEESPLGFRDRWRAQEEKLRQAVAGARGLLPQVVISDELLHLISRVAVEMGVDGHRADIVMMKTAKTLAALEGRRAAERSDVLMAAELALPHRVRRKPFQKMGLEEGKLAALLAG